MRRRIGQVIAPLLIIQRVATKRALTSNAITSKHLSSFKVRSRGISIGGNVTLPDRDPMSFVDGRRMDFGEFGDRGGTTTDFHRDRI